ncbi:MAG: hypothetical protein OXI41_10610 [Chloroflexota bacterium]|nr:hypothetical protein [Chloroflexota bacterium]MDE2893974.1 hypothetical protein [Chloroflexota bacterium]
MAIRIDRPLFRDIFARMEIPQAPADDFVDAVEDTVNEGRDELATKDDLLAMEVRLRADAAEREARILQNQLGMVGVMLGALAIATGIIIAVVTLSA